MLVSNIFGHFFRNCHILRVWKITYLNNCASLCRISTSSTTLCLWLMVKDYYSHFFSHYYTLWKLKNFSVTQTIDEINFCWFKDIIWFSCNFLKKIWVPENQQISTLCISITDFTSLYFFLQRTLYIAHSIFPIGPFFSYMQLKDHLQEIFLCSK